MFRIISWSSTPATMREQTVLVLPLVHTHHSWRKPSNGRKAMCLAKEHLERYVLCALEQIINAELCAGWLYIGTSCIFISFFWWVFKYNLVYGDVWSRLQWLYNAATSLYLNVYLRYKKFNCIQLFFNTFC